MDNFIEYDRYNEMVPGGTCHKCGDIYALNSMLEDIDGNIYCLECADICPSCGVLDHECEPAEANQYN